MNNRFKMDIKTHWLYALSFFALVSVLVAGITPTYAQAQPRVQELTDVIDPGGEAVYLLSGLEQGQRLYIYVETTSGNLDPLAALIDSGVDLEALGETYQQRMETAARDDLDPTAAVDAVLDRFTLAWDDDSGEGYAAAFEYTIPQDGEYNLIVAGALSSLGRETFGSFRLLAGLNAPEVLTGEAEPSGEPFATPDMSVLQPVVRVQEVGATISPENPVHQYNLREFFSGDELFVYAETASGDLTPIMLLLDYGGKPLTVGNLAGTASTASLRYLFSERSENTVLEIYGSDPDGPVRSGDYRLLIGVNEPDVLTGRASSTEQAVIRKPIEVKTGIKLQQIVDVNPQNEFFTVVASMQMEWTDPALAFSPDTCQCNIKVYTEKEFDRFLADVEGRWPDFTLFNQQGNRWVQNRVVTVEPDGKSRYFERFSTNFQVDFDFRQFPFDNQQFQIRVDMLYPVEFYSFADLEGYSEISQDHGDDEFVITGFETSISSVQSSTQSTVSRYTFEYEAPRHLNYYILQVFVPILLIVAISWWTFFLKDYNKRIEVAAGNVLLFIAFSFSLAENYPRLGYMTLLDAIMAMIFIVNALVLIYNVYMRRLEMAGRAEQAERIDNVMDWLYPLLYIVSLGVVYFLFFVQTPPA